MSFGTILALAIGLLVVAPLVAHLLRRGKTKEIDFPAAHLVPDIVVTSEQRRRVEDRLLLSLRALMVLALAVLGATPFVRCSRLNVDRQAGASVAMAIVLDDSQSMRARVPDGVRFELARTGASELLGSLREGDAVALVLAGRPARVVLSSTTDLAQARRALEAVRQTDRATELNDAVQLARATIRELPHVDKRVVVLSDLATATLPKGKPEIWTPLEGLSADALNCGIASAEHQGRVVTVKLGCNDGSAAEGREVELYEATEGDAVSALASESLGATSGEQKLQLRHSSQGLDLLVRLTGKDALPDDDRAEVAAEAVAQTLAVVADASRASVMTGGPTVVEQALAALAPEATIKPLSSVPENAEDLKPFAAIVVDDPPGLSPGARAALSEWLERGGVALALLGPAATSAQLASTLEPFAREGAQWENQGASLRWRSLAWLGPEAESFEALANLGRVRLDATDLPGTEIVGVWADDVPFLFRRETGRGLVFTLGLPAAVETSDLALRPGFLALLDRVRDEATQRSGPRQSLAGTPWTFESETKLRVLTQRGTPLSEAPSHERAERRFVPELAGRYTVQNDGTNQARWVVLDVSELTTRPLRPQERVAVAATGPGNDMTDASPEWAILLLGLLAIELGARAFGERLRERFGGTRARA